MHLINARVLIISHRCLRVGGLPCECVVGRGRGEMCVCVRARALP